MDSNNLKVKDDTHPTAILVMAVIILSGLLLIAISVPFPETGLLGYAREILKELGVVLVSVFGVSLLYERTLARRYVNSFLNHLKTVIQQGESNSAMSARLGISEIFSSRDIFNLRYPFSTLVANLDSGDSLRVVARSMYVLMTQAPLLQQAIARGATVELCLVNPKLPKEKLLASFGLSHGDIDSAVSTIGRTLVDWLTEKKPKGKFEVRFHEIPLLDSYLQIHGATRDFCTWDLNFGRASSEKKVLVLESNKPLAKDLSARYDEVWHHADRVYEYDGSKIVVDLLPR